MGNSLGQKIKEIRLKKGLNMEDFGKLINNANKSLVSKWENDKSVPGIERLHLISDIGKIPIEELIESQQITTSLNEIRYIADNLDSSILYFNILTELLDSLDSKINNFNIMDKYESNVLENFYTDLSNINRQLQSNRYEFYQIKEAVIAAYKFINQVTLRNNPTIKDTNISKPEYTQQLLPGFENETSEVETDLKVKVDVSYNIDLEEVFSSNTNLILNNKPLSINDKHRTLQILKLVFPN
ncbi:helix-turn-helix domain-containing protein [Psychrobacillus psychrotolerans]|uniref:helix-turn-helix domain-containing protein n=1 Tax=Psychrobacillus psychrotolerans TaxID=126156 RepID=UPI003314A155